MSDTYNFDDQAICINTIYNPENRLHEFYNTDLYQIIF